MRWGDTLSTLGKLGMSLGPVLMVSVWWCSLLFTLVRVTPILKVKSWIFIIARKKSMKGFTDKDGVLVIIFANNLIYM